MASRIRASRRANCSSGMVRTTLACSSSASASVARESAIALSARVGSRVPSDAVPPIR
jgi:hypothetical protein